MTQRLFRTQQTMFWWEGSPLHQSMNSVEKRFARHYFEHDIRLGIVDGAVETAAGRVDMIALDSRVPLSEFLHFQKVYGRRLRLAVCWLWEAYRLSALRDAAMYDLLTQRQIECLAWVSAGLNSDAIADRLKISAHTVNEHLGSATRRLGAHNRAQACARAVLLGLVTP
jgi:DNA-binding CsgD family transcriptional regulator